MTHTLASWRDTVAASWHCSTSQELMERITSFLFWILCSIGVKDLNKNEVVIVACTVRDVMTCRRDVFMTLFNILGTNCTIYIVFVLNPMLQKPRNKKIKPSSGRVSWRHDVTPRRHHDSCMIKSPNPRVSSKPNPRVTNPAIELGLVTLEFGLITLGLRLVTIGLCGTSTGS